jgi:N6-adenosine-specific RNA methylase IME4/ParB-like chromosome segregation protein Spo0J
MLDNITVRLIKLSDIDVPPNRMRRLRPKKVDEIAESMNARGLGQAILVTPQGDAFRLIFGHHRLEGARKLGWTDIRAEVREGLAADEAELLEIDENLCRADLTDAEQAAHHARRKTLYLRLHPETKKGGAPGKAGGGKKKREEAQNEPLRSYTSKTAAEIGKSNATVKRAVARGEKIANVSELAGTCLDKGEELDALAKLPEPVQQDLIERTKAGEKVTAKFVAHRLRREERERELAAATEAASKTLGQELFGLMYVDCPLHFDAYVSGAAEARAPEAHYPTLTIDQLKALKVPAAPNCVLFLWATVSHFAVVIDIMRAWGFEYKTHVVWKKDKVGLGYWFRSTHELLLVGVRGEVPAPAQGEQFLSVIEAPRGRHSEKPDVFAEMIEKMFPTTPKVELFAHKERRGWRVWGNEAPLAPADTEVTP